MIKGNSYIKSRGLFLVAMTTLVAAGILMDTTGVLALVGLGVGIGFAIAILLKG